VEASLALIAAAVTTFALAFVLERTLTDEVVFTIAAVATHDVAAAVTRVLLSAATAEEVLAAHTERCSASASISAVAALDAAFAVAPWHLPLKPPPALLGKQIRAAEVLAHLLLVGAGEVGSV